MSKEERLGTTFEAHFYGIVIMAQILTKEEQLKQCLEFDDGFDYWLIRAKEVFPKVGGLYRVKHKRGMAFALSGKQKLATQGIVLMVVWVESPSSWARRQADFDQVNNVSSHEREIMRNPQFPFRVLWGEKIWDKKYCDCNSWSYIFEHIPTKL